MLELSVEYFVYAIHFTFVYLLLLLLKRVTTRHTAPHRTTIINRIKSFEIECENANMNNHSNNNVAYEKYTSHNVERTKKQKLSAKHHQI